MATASGAYASAQTVPCPTTSTSCSVTNQTVGDTTNPSSASGTTSTSSLSGTSAASNASNLTISPTNNAQTTQNSTNTTTGMITGGNTTSSSSGGNSMGNMTTSANTSSANTGASTASNGGNMLSNGPNTNILGGASSTSGASTSSLAGNMLSTGGNTLGGAASTVGNTSTGASNSSTSVDASNHSSSTTNEKFVFIPPIIPPTPPSTLAVGNIIKETGACGPLQRIAREPVLGTFFGLARNLKVQQGYTDHLEPYLDERGVEQQYRRVPMQDGVGYRVFGHQVTQYTTVLGVSGVRNIALGGGGSGGGWAQAGMGVSGSMQQLVTSIELRECEVGVMLPREAPTPKIVYVEPKRIRE